MRYAVGSYCLFPRTPGLFSSLNVQKNMLQDAVRNHAFEAAIRAAVQPGDIVIDLGTGTGILAIWAASAGAERVYAIEETDVANAAEGVVKQNGYADRITVMRTNSGLLELEQRADVLIAELVGHFLFEEGILEYVADVRERLLKPGAKIIPASAEVFIAPVELRVPFEELTYWDTWKWPDLSSIRRSAADSAYVHAIAQGELIASPTKLFEIDFSAESPGRLTSQACFRVSRNARCDGLAGWFGLDLGNGVSLSTGPADPPTHWRQCLFPFYSPVTLQSGEELTCGFDIETLINTARWRWKASAGPGFCERHEIPVVLGSRLFYERF